MQAFGGPQRRQIRFVSNIDGHAFNDAVTGLDPRRCLVVVSSSPSPPPRPCHNARAAIAWLRRGGVTDVAAHLAAVTANAAAARALGVPAERVFSMCDWVGGRYSVWSVAGLSIALTVGAEVLIGMRAGARPWTSISGWRRWRQCAGAAGACRSGQLQRAGPQLAEHRGLQRARLLHLVTYLQQLEMESLGKRVAGDGQAVGVPSAPIIWGMPGTDGQHTTFFQWLHQSENGAPVDFIASLQGCPDNLDAHRMLLANCLAQRQALLRGKSLEQALLDVAHIDDRERALRLARHMVHPGGRPSSLIVLQARPAWPGRAAGLVRAQGVRAERGLGHQSLRPMGRGAGQAAGHRHRARAGGAGVGGRGRPGHDASTSYWIDCYRGHAQAPLPRHAWVPGVAAHL